jgi:DNA-binding IclR family transcriptional regulator
MRVLECVSSHPGINNRQVGDLAGIADQGQVSKLLSRLRQVGLLSNDGEDNPRGMPNVWRLTATGERVAHGVASGVHLTRELHSAHYPPEQWSAAAASSPEIPDALRDPRSHRARCCLVHLAAHPGSSNREIADGVGISSHSQISTLLRRLCDMGMVSKRAGGAGQANAWVLTDLGVRVARAVSGSDGGRSGG